MRCLKLMVWPRTTDRHSKESKNNVLTVKVGYNEGKLMELVKFQRTFVRKRLNIYIARIHLPIKGEQNERLEVSEYRPHLARYASIDATTPTPCGSREKANECENSMCRLFVIFPSFSCTRLK